MYADFGDNVCVSVQGSSKLKRSVRSEQKKMTPVLKSDMVCFSL